MMIEWTVCSNCGKILDNSQTKCPSCNGSVSKTNMDCLTKQLSDLVFVVNTLNIFKPYCDSMSDLDVSLESIIYDDLFKWFAYLGLGDDVITDNELEFINTLLNSTYTRDDLLNLTELKLDDEIPLSFRCLEELDAFARTYDMNRVNTAHDLYECYKLFAKFFITVDNELNSDVLNQCNDYLAQLKGKVNIAVDDTSPTQIRTIEPDDEESDEKTLDDYLDELNSLIGLTNVKKDVNSLINLVQIRRIRQSRGIKQPSMSLHLVFSGNPGTGKTTVARLLAKIYHKIGVLSKGHLIEADRSGLVGGYVGQTAIKTSEVIN